ncbi:hypothetical protein GNP73_10680 [Aliivibrio fischeri]|uniref:hypothetical protein n=1 Tax=Aliivibrio fischeri TaxID=668 RepID=UPI0012DAC34F|nr:hypothetical protein [Aliivibrio fischeri]MUJ28432.1 hypothetical protein [Aliivibrio fischeri]
MGYLFNSWSSGNLEVGDAATWLAAISTLGAAVGTVGSLVMLNRQHKQNVEHQERVWKKQEDSLDFARYRDHKAQFEQLLDSLEDKHKSFYAFKDKTQLYRRLFPNNSPRNEYSEYKFKLSPSDLTDQHPLKNAWEYIDKVDRIIRTHGAGRVVQRGAEEDFEIYPNPTPIHQLEDPIFRTASHLGLTCTRTPKTGDLINTDEVFASVFDPLVMRTHSNDIFESINEFCGLESPRKKGLIYSPIGIGFEMLYYYRREDVPEYNSVSSGHYRIVDILFKLDRLAKLLHHDHVFSFFVRSLFGVPWNKALLVEFEDKEKIIDYLEQATIHLGIVIGQSEHLPELKNQAIDVLDYIKKQTSTT